MKHKRFSAKAYPSRSMAWAKETCEGTFDEIKAAIEIGAFIYEQQLRSGIEYRIKYPSGGNHKISKRIFDKLKT
jgi:hypothetical protein